MQHVLQDQQNKYDLLVVTSLAVNTSTATDGYDDDDISSAVSSPLRKRLMRRRQTLALSAPLPSPTKQGKLRDSLVASDNWR